MNCLGHFGGCGITPPIWSLINYTYQPPPPNNLSSPGIDSNASVTEHIKKTPFFGGKNMNLFWEGDLLGGSFFWEAFVNLENNQNNWMGMV